MVMFGHTNANLGSIASLVFHIAGLVISFVALFMSLSMVTSNTSWTPLFLSTHVVHGDFKSPLDHSYVAFDANIHPFHHYQDISKPGSGKFVYPVDNECFVTPDVDSDTKTNSYFCGMLPWQEGANLCTLGTETSASIEFIAHMTVEGYTATKDTDGLSDLLQAKGLVKNDEKEHADFSEKSYYRHKSQQICQYESYNGAQIVLNEDSAYSLNSAHSVWVLWVAVWSIVFMSFAMSLKNAWFKNKYILFSNPVSDFLPREKWPVVIDYLALVVVLGIYLIGVMWYGAHMPSDRALLRPNGSFAYSFIAIVYSWLFLRKSTTLKWNENDTTQATGSKPIDEPVNTEPVNTDPKSKMSLDMSNFSTKIKSDAFMQAGDGGRYVLEASLKDDIRNLDIDDYEKVEINCSHFQSTQLWVLPFVTLIAHIYDKNFDIDIHVTVVFLLSMMFCILDVFSKKVTQLHEIILGFETEKKSDQWYYLFKQFHASSLLLLVQLVNVILQFSIFLYLYRFFDSPLRDVNGVSFGSDWNWKTYWAIYYGVNVFFKIVRILATTFKTNELIHAFLENHVYENVCMFVLWLILFIYFVRMFEDQRDALYTKPTDCDNTDNNLFTSTCEMMIKWGKNYDFNTGVVFDARDY